MTTAIPRQIDVCSLCGTPLGETRMVTAGPWIVDSSRGTVTYKDLPVHFTGSEAKIFELLARRPGTVFTKEMILNAVDTYAEQKIVDVFICKIRKKLREALGEEVSKQIVTIWGRGYVLQLDPKDANFVSPLAPRERWTPTLKRSVLYSLTRGEMTDEQFCEENGVQLHELEEWRRQDAFGDLKVTTLGGDRRRKQEQTS